MENKNKLEKVSVKQAKVLISNKKAHYVGYPGNSQLGLNYGGEVYVKHDPRILCTHYVSESYIEKENKIELKKIDIPEFLY